jgi:thiol-disulfide isomerase/thioredoxin
MAYERGVSPSDVKLEGNQWVACVGGACQLLAKALPSEIAERRVNTVIAGLHIGERLTIHGHALSEHIVEGQAAYGIPGLGTFERKKDGSITFTASSDFKGTVAKATPPTTTPSSSVSVAHGHYTPKLASETSDILTAELDTTLVLVISVPSQCGPCRQYINDIYDAAAAFKPGTKLKFAVLDFDSFEDARRIMGKIKAFPATVIFPSVQANKREGEKKPATSLSLASIDRPGYQFHGRLDSIKLRGVIIGAESKATRSLKGITQVTPDSLTPNR